MANNYTFNAGPFKDLINQATNLENSICDNLETIAKKCQYMSEIVASEDSNLSEKWGQFAYSLGRPTNSIKDIFAATKKKLQEYVDETMENEKAAAIELEELDNFLAEFGTMTDSLSGGTSSAVGWGAAAIAGAAAAISGVGQGAAAGIAAGAKAATSGGINTPYPAGTIGARDIIKNGNSTYYSYINPQQTASYKSTPVVYGPAPTTTEYVIGPSFEDTPVVYGPAPRSNPITGVESNK